jgi:hypothetical protein
VASTNPRISVEIEAGADPIRGTIDDADGNRLTFWGWLELIEELRRVAAGEATLPRVGDSTATRSTRHGDQQNTQPDPQSTTGDQP